MEVREVKVRVHWAPWVVTRGHGVCTANICMGKMWKGEVDVVLKDISPSTFSETGL
jgi:hypothetical protein